MPPCCQTFQSRYNKSEKRATFGGRSTDVDGSKICCVDSGLCVCRRVLGIDGNASIKTPNQTSIKRECKRLHTIRYRTSNPLAAQRNHHESNRWTKYWEGLIDFAERRDKAIVAVGTAFIALFTVVLALSTLFLRLATRNLVSGAAETSERQLRAYVTISETFLSFRTSRRNFPRKLLSKSRTRDKPRHSKSEHLQLLL